MTDKLKIKLTIESAADKELFNYLNEFPPRRRAFICREAALKWIQSEQTQKNYHEETFKTEVQTPSKPSMNNQGDGPIQESENSIELLSGLDF